MDTDLQTLTDAELQGDFDWLMACAKEHLAKHTDEGDDLAEWALGCAKVILGEMHLRCLGG